MRPATRLPWAGWKRRGDGPVRTRDEVRAMISIGRFRARTCQGLTRREFLRFGAAAPLALGLGAGAAAGPAEAQGTGRARAILLVWLWGGPSHVDHFDPNPPAPAQLRGPFATIPTRTPGLRFTELVPQLAARSDR